MRLKHILSTVIVLAILLFPITTLAQQSKSTDKSIFSASDIDAILRNAGMPPDVQIVKVNVNGSISMSNPVVILGSGIDAMENQLFQAVSAGYGVNSSYILNDKTRTFNSKGIESYDLVVVGGPDHNAYTKELLGRGVLKYNATDVKGEGLIVEVERLPGGHTVVVVASVTGYPYREKAAINGSTPKPVPGQATARPDTSNDAVSPINDTDQNSVVNDMMSELGELGPSLRLKPNFQYVSDVKKIIEKWVDPTVEETKFLREHQDVLWELFGEMIKRAEDIRSQPMEQFKEDISDQPGVIGDMGANLG